MQQISDTHLNEQHDMRRIQHEYTLNINATGMDGGADGDLINVSHESTEVFKVDERIEAAVAGGGGSTGNENSMSYGKSDAKAPSVHANFRLWLIAEAKQINNIPSKQVFKTVNLDVE